MVYRGPRRGCLNCKKRRRKCDNVQPVCGMCLKTRQECVNPGHALDAVLRHEFAKYAGRAEGQKAILLNQPEDLVLKPQLNPNISTTDAVYFFMQSYSFKPRVIEASQGYLELVQSAFWNASSNSPLIHVVTLLSVYLQEAWSDLFPESDRGRRYLARALKSVNNALNDPDERVKDETLLAVLLLDLHHSLSNLMQSRPASRTHFDGVVALINCRGFRNYETEMAKKLMAAVRHSIIAHSNARGVTVDTTTPMWHDGYDSASLNKAVELDMLCLRLNGLGKIAEILIDRAADTGQASPPRATTLSIQLFDCFKEVHSLEKAFETWYCTVPTAWLPLSVDGHAEFGMYRNLCHVYLELNVATLLNNYRTSRAILLKWLIELSSKGSGFWTQQDALFRTTFQQLIDDFCASVPFYLGNKFDAADFTDPKIFYPGIPGCPEANCDNARQATAFGGAVLLGPIRSVLGLTSVDTTSETPLLREGQREWLKRQLIRIALMYNVRLDPSEYGGAIPPLAANALTLEYHGKGDASAIGDGVTIRY